MLRTHTTTVALLPAPRATPFVGSHSQGRCLLHLRLTSHPRSPIVPTTNTMYSSFPLWLPHCSVAYRSDSEYYVFSIIAGLLCISLFVGTLRGRLRWRLQAPKLQASDLAALLESLASRRLSAASLTPASVSWFTVKVSAESHDSMLPHQAARYADAAGTHCRIPSGCFTRLRLTHRRRRREERSRSVASMSSGTVLAAAL